MGSKSLPQGASASFLGLSPVTGGASPVTEGLLERDTLPAFRLEGRDLGKLHLNRQEGIMDAGCVSSRHKTWGGKRGAGLETLREDGAGTFGAG